MVVYRENNIGDAMNMILILTPLAVSLIAIVYGLIKLMRASKAPVGNRKVLDAGRTIEAGTRSQIMHDFAALGVAVAVIFIVILYLLGWKTALSFIIGASITGVASHFSAIFSARSYARVADLARTDQIKSANTAIGIGGASSLLASGSAVLAAVAIYAIFKDATLLIPLAFGGILTAIISKLNSHNLTVSGEIKDAVAAGAKSNITVSSSIGAILAMSAVATSFGINAYPGDQYAAYFPFLLLGAGIVAMFIGSMFTSIKKSSGILRIILPALIIPSILLLAGSYFLSNWTILGVGAKSPLNVCFAVSIGVVVPLILLAKCYFIYGIWKLDQANSRMISNIILVILAAASILGSYYFAGYFGIALLAIGIVSYLIPMISGSRALAVFEGADETRKLAGVETDTAEIKIAYDNLGRIREYFGTYPYLVGIIAVVAVLFLSLQTFSDTTSTASFSLLNPYLVSGILLGGLLTYYFASTLEGEVKHGLIIPVSVLIVVPILLGIFLGVPITAGLLIGVIFASIILALREGKASSVLIPLAVGAILILFNSLLILDYSVKARLIIGIVAVIIILVYVLITRVLMKEAK